MPSRPAFAEDITVHHARLVGRSAGRGALERAMAGVHSGDVTDREEMLLIPCFRCEVPLSSAKPPAYFAQKLSTQLLDLRRSALVNPSGFSGSGKVLRFTTRAAFAFWVLAGWLRGGDAAIVVSKSLEGGSIVEWQRKHVLNDARLLVKLVGALARAGLAARWAGRLTALDIALATPQLGQAYRVPVTIWEVAREQPLTAASCHYPLLQGDSRRSDSAHFPLKHAPPLTQKPSALSITPIIAAARQAGNDIANLDEPARRFVAVTLALSASPNIGPRLDKIDWEMSFQPSQTDFQTANTPPDIAASQLAAKIPSAITTISDGRLRRSKPDMVHRAPRRISHGTADVQAEREAWQDVNVPPTMAQVVAPSGMPSAHAVDADGDPAVQFSTEFGGIFFLVNVFAALGFYPDFTRPLDKGLDVSPFWLLDRLALRMFGACYRSDPLHRWLGKVGRGGALPRRWAIDPDWLDGIGQPTRMSRHQCRNRQTIWDARGFAVLDMPRRQALRLGSAKAWKGRGGVNAQTPGPVRRLPSAASERWIVCLAMFLEFRLGMAKAGLSSAIFRTPAQIRVREDSVSVQFALASLPMSIRMAGLDRNPGWLPAEGRDLMFEFI